MILIIRDYINISNNLAKFYLNFFFILIIMIVVLKRKIILN